MSEMAINIVPIGTMGDSVDGGGWSVIWRFCGDIVRDGLVSSRDIAPLMS